MGQSVVCSGTLTVHPRFDAAEQAAVAEARSMGAVVAHRHVPMQALIGALAAAGLAVRAGSGAPFRPATEAERLALLHAAIGNAGDATARFHAMRGTRRLRDRVAGFITACKEAGLDARRAMELADQVADERLSALAALFAAYESQRVTLGLLDPDDNLALAVEALERGSALPSWITGSRRIRVAGVAEWSARRVEIVSRLGEVLRRGSSAFEGIRVELPYHPYHPNACRWLSGALSQFESFGEAPVEIVHALAEAGTSGALRLLLPRLDRTEPSTGSGEERPTSRVPPLRIAIADTPETAAHRVAEAVADLLHECSASEIAIALPHAAEIPFALTSRLEALGVPWHARRGAPLDRLPLAGALRDLVAVGGDSMDVAALERSLASHIVALEDNRLRGLCAELVRSCGIGVVGSPGRAGLRRLLDDMATRAEAEAAREATSAGDARDEEDAEGFGEDSESRADDGAALPDRVRDALRSLRHAEAFASAGTALRAAIEEIDSLVGDGQLLATSQSTDAVREIVARRIRAGNPFVLSSRVTRPGSGGDAAAAVAEATSARSLRCVLDLLADIGRSAVPQCRPVQVALFELLAEERLRPPGPRGGAVSIVGVTELGDRKLRHVFLLGLTEGTFPRGARPDSMLPDSVRARVNAAARSRGARQPRTEAKGAGSTVGSEAPWGFAGIPLFLLEERPLDSDMTPTRTSEDDLRLLLAAQSAEESLWLVASRADDAGRPALISRYCELLDECALEDVERLDWPLAPLPQRRGLPDERLAALAAARTRGWRLTPAGELDAALDAARAGSVGHRIRVEHARQVLAKREAAAIDPKARSRAGGAGASTEVVTAGPPVAGLDGQLDGTGAGASGSDAGAQAVAEETLLAPWTGQIGGDARAWIAARFGMTEAHPGSASRIDAYAKSPLGMLYSRIIGVRELRLPDPAIDRIASGQMLHAVMERVVRAAGGTGAAWVRDPARPVRPESLGEHAERELDAQVALWRPRFPWISARQWEAFRGVWRRRLPALCETLSDPAIRETYPEVAFGSGGRPPLRIELGGGEVPAVFHGRIDRVDRVGQEPGPSAEERSRSRKNGGRDEPTRASAAWWVIDYKSSPESKLRERHGRSRDYPLGSLQVGLYLLAAQTVFPEAAVAGIRGSYLSLVEPDKGGVPRAISAGTYDLVSSARLPLGGGSRDRFLAGLAREERCDTAFRGVLANLVRGIRSGTFPVRVAKEYGLELTVIVRGRAADASGADLGEGEGEASDGD